MVTESIADDFGENGRKSGSVLLLHEKVSSLGTDLGGPIPVRRSIGASDFDRVPMSPNQFQPVG